MSFGYLPKRGLGSWHFPFLSLTQSSSETSFILFRGTGRSIANSKMGLRMSRRATLVAVLYLFNLVAADTVPSSEPVPILITSGGQAFVNNNAVLVGNTNTTLTPITASTKGVQLSWQPLKNHVIKVEVKSNCSFTGAKFTVSDEDRFYGVWGYPFSGQLNNKNVSFELKGVGNAEGINCKQILMLYCCSLL